MKEDDGYRAAVVSAPWLPKWLTFLSGIPRWRRRKRILVMLQAFVDDSGGKGQGSVFVFSGLVDSAENWDAFSESWDVALKESPSIRYFKMDEAVLRKEQFRGFSCTERDEKLKLLCGIINTFAPTELSCDVNLKDFAKTLAITAGRPLCEPYFFPFHMMNMAVAYEVLRQGSSEPFEIFFDENVIFGPRAKAWYPIILAMMEDAPRSVMPVEPLFRSDLDVLPLQAADLMAWIARTNKGSGLGRFDWLPSALGRVKRSPLSKTLDTEMIQNFCDEDSSPEFIAKREASLISYRETFGFDWPPENKQQRKSHRGNKNR